MPDPWFDDRPAELAQLMQEGLLDLLVFAHDGASDYQRVATG
jgi:hypothetical protein